MSDDRSLDEFADVDQSVADRSADDSKGEPADDSKADPASATATWTTDGADCDRCGTSVQRRWDDDGAFVCAACKTW